MKHFLTLLFSLFLFNFCFAQQYTWVQKAPLPASPRYESVGVSLNGKGYFMTGLGVVPSSFTYYNDNWEYDPITNVWTQKANFPGTARYGACGFVIGNKIYVGTGWDPAAQTDFYAFDPATNLWSPIANFPGPARYDAVGFTIGNKGYVGFGYAPNFSDFYEYDPALNTWTQKANFPGGDRQSLSTFSINGLGYICGGSDAGSTIYDDLWEFNPIADTWTQKANFPGGARYATTGFTLNNKGLVGGGWNITQSFNDYYLYNPTTDTWCQTATYPGTARYSGDGFVIGQDGYAGLGRDNANNYYNDFYKLEKAIASFAITTLPCNLSVGFNSTATNATGYSWTFGDGNTSSVANPNHTYSALGTYNVQLIVYYNCGTDTINQQVLLTGVTPIAAFNYSQNPCSYTINFTNQSTNANSYNWDFGDSNTATTATPNHTYANTGNYTVTLIVINACDSDTLQQLINVAAIAPPAVAAYTATVTPCSYTVNFINTSSSATSYLWQYGDGNSNTTSLANHTYTYATGGAYNVNLIAINSCDSDTLQLQVVIPVINVPVPAYTQQQTSCTTEVQFTNTTVNGVTYLWSFGDGNTSTLSSPTNTYSTTGNYNVTLTVYGSCDTVSTLQQINVLPPAVAVAGFNYTANSCDSSITFTNTAQGATSYQWSFGDGNTSTLTQPTHQYAASGNYTVTQVVINLCDTDTIQQTIFIPAYTPAIAAFNYTAPPCTTQVTFNNQSSNALSYLWSFGDGSFDTNSNPVHQYTTASNFSVTLIASDNCKNDSVTIQVDLTAAAAPVAAFTTNVQPCDSIAISFNNNSVNALSYLWSFGDGTTSTNSTPYHVYSIPGTYIVTLNAVNNCDTNIVLQNVIVDSISTPVADFQFSITPCTSTATFINNSTGANSYYWNFGDGNTSTVQSPENTYVSTGTFMVTLIINNGQPCRDSLSLPVTITALENDNWFMPNCFTPNGDGLNDVLEIVGLNDCSEYSMIIFNRWGQKIFETTATLKVWDGTFNSKKSPESVYLYVVTVNGQKSSGTVSLLR